MRFNSNSNESNYNGVSLLLILIEVQHCDEHWACVKAMLFPNNVQAFEIFVQYHYRIITYQFSEQKKQNNWIFLYFFQPFVDHLMETFIISHKWICYGGFFSLFFYDNFKYYAQHKNPMQYDKIVKSRRWLVIIMIEFPLCNRYYERKSIAF